MIITQATKICNLLNQALEADRDCIEQLMTFHAIGHSEQLRNHPSILVRKWQNKLDPPKFTLSVLGLLNGLCVEGELVIAIYSDGGLLLRFEVVQSGSNRISNSLTT